MKYLSVLALALLIAACGGQKTEPAKAPATDSTAVAADVSYSKEIQPIFANSCMPCHSGAADAKSKYDLSKYEGAMAKVVAGKADSSLLYVILKDGKMPPAGPLPAATVELVKKWIDQGAKNN